ncbi:hypothetical protein [Nitrospina watsonii]|uniref:Uncharacterized protein n=1 Tax=Nitrospina watsonii TaxID=1323948 RepID=A0ABM9HC53_9BACT|nr:hypothetical protein [Nitrospina watsonii]CAI2717666.1 conserved exported protein of unknown function [Nitrospina watsonii]
MRATKTLFACVTICSMMAFGATTALGAGEKTVEPWFVEGFNNEEMILEPGTTAFCNKDITVQNLSEDEVARVRIARGNGDNYDWDKLEPNETLGYKKGGVSIFAIAPGKRGPNSGPLFDEARIVNATMGHAKLKILCK